MSSTPRAFTVRIFLADGLPEGVRVVEKSNWNGRGLVCPRPRLNQAQMRKEFGEPGVYLLVGASQKSDLPAIYIGEGDPVRNRLQSHNADPKKDFWTQAVFFTGNLNKAHIQHLESRLIELANEAKRCVLENGNIPALPSLSEIDLADSEGFLEEMLLCLGVLGFDFFQRPTQQALSVTELRLTGKGLNATGYESDNGFVVKRHSEATLETAKSASTKSLALRDELRQLGVLTLVENKYKFIEDYEFSSPSAASDFILGSSSNGRALWKDEKGRSMNDLAALKSQFEVQA